MKILAHPRMPFCAPKGKLIVECDYSSQELRIGAALSKDQKMTNAFLAPEFIEVSGEKYPNPTADLHSISSIYCINPGWFENTPENLWVKRSKEVPPGQKCSPRDYGKRLNFAEIYLATPRSIAELNHVSVKTAEEWDKGHKETYRGYYEWAAEVGKIASARGFAINARSRVRYCDEANSKGAGESTERNAVNFNIQGFAADCTKQADLECEREFRGTDVVCLLAVHDALVFEIPGYAELDEEKSKVKDGVYTKLAFKANKEAEEIAARIVQIMEDVETQMFRDVGSPVPGKAEAGISLYWSH